MAATNPSLLRYDGRTGVNLSGKVVPFATDDSWNAMEADRLARERASMAGHRRLVNFGRLASLAPAAFAFAPGGVLAAGGGGGEAMAANAAGGGWSMPGVSAPVFGTSGAATSAPGVMATAKIGLGARLGSIFNSSGMNLGVNSGLALLGMRSQNKAADQARADALAGQREALAVERQRLEMEARNADLDREDAKALNAAINELKKRELDAAEEERSYTRTRADQQDARLEPYRQRGRQALDRLSAMWSLG